MPRKQHTYHFIYKTTCMINEKFYIGMHSTSNLEDGYIGSGKRLWNSIRKHGKENFKFEILEWYPDRNTLKTRERELVNCEMLQNPLCMNLTIGGGSATKEAQRKGGSVTGRSNRILGLRNYTKETRHRVMKERHASGSLKPLDWTGKKHSEETKQLFSKMRKGNQSGEKNSQFGTYFVNKDGKNMRIKKAELETYLESGWTKGRKGRY